MRGPEDGVLVSRELPDGKILDVWWLTLGRVRLTVSEDERAEGYIEGW